MAPLCLLLLLALAAPTWATWDTCEGTCGLRPMAEELGSGSGPVSGAVSGAVSGPVSGAVSGAVSGPVRGAWPGLASIQDPHGPGSGHVCGGSLISPAWVLTAARCFPPDRNVSTWRVVLGAWDLSDPGPEAQVRQVRRLQVHAALDVALLQLQRPVECSDFVQLGCPAPAHLPPQHLRGCYLGGWGSLGGTGAAAREVLREVPVRLLQPELCSGAAAQVCAEHSGGGARTCQGDGGGPLVCRDPSSEQFWIVGVTSRGRGCVFTPAWLFSEWLLLQLQPPEPPGTPGTPGTTGTTGTTGSPGPLGAVLLQFFSVLRELLRFLRHPGH